MPFGQTIPCPNGCKEFESWKSLQIHLKLHCRRGGKAATTKETMELIHGSWEPEGPSPAPLDPLVALQSVEAETSHVEELPPQPERIVDRTLDPSSRGRIRRLPCHLVDMQPTLRSNLFRRRSPTPHAPPEPPPPPNAAARS
jgi:hypothetical protein